MLRRRRGADGDRRAVDSHAAAQPGAAVTVAVVAGLGGLAAFELVRAAAITARFANEDTSIVWVMARDWIKGRIHQPNYYGQSYGSTLEGIPIGMLHALGTSYGTSTAVVLVGLEAVGWVLLAWAAWRRGHRVMAALAVAMPVVLGAYHTVYVTFALLAPLPRLMVIAAAALLIAMPSRPTALAAAVLLLGVGLQFDSGSALLAGPLLAWYGVGYLRSRAQVHAMLLGSVVPAGLLAYTKVFYWRHPDYALHLAPSLRASASTLRASSHHLGAFFGLYAPEVWRSWLAPVIVLGTLVVLLVATRQARYALPGLLAALLVVYAMGTTRARAESALGPLLPQGRILLALPVTIWFLFFLAAETNTLGSLRSRLAIPILVVLCTVSVVSTALRVVDYHAREGFWRTKAIALSRVGLYPFAPTAIVMGQCHAQLSLAQRHHIGLIVYHDQHAAYTCAALAPTGINTLFAGLFDRRTWVLYHELRYPRSGLIVVHPAQDFCALARQRATCSLIKGYAILSFPSQSALSLLASMGFYVRDFGPDCHPGAFFGTCRGRATDLARRPFGAPPADQQQARDAIIAAYQAMFTAVPNTTIFPTVENGDRLPDLPHQLQAIAGPADRPTVTSVQFLDDHEATVRYRIGPNHATGEAVIQKGTWRVAMPTFCTAIQLLAQTKPVHARCPDFLFE